MADLETQFTEAMLTIYTRAKSEARCNARLFLQMVVDNGGLRTAKTLINSARPSDGLYRPL
jgi:hypothetical protein